MPKNKFDETFYLKAKNLVETGIALPESIIGCSQAEIDSLEAHFQIDLPLAYKAFLKYMGHGAGLFLETKTLYHELVLMNTLARADWTTFEVNGCENYFCFFMHEGHEWYLFDSTEGPDPTVINYGAARYLEIECGFPTPFEFWPFSFSNYTEPERYVFSSNELEELARKHIFALRDIKAGFAAYDHHAERFWGKDQFKDAEVTCKIRAWMKAFQTVKPTTSQAIKVPYEIDNKAGVLSAKMVDASVPKHKKQC